MKGKGSSEVIISIISPLFMSAWITGNYISKNNTCKGFTYDNTSDYNSNCDCQHKAYSFVMSEVSISVIYGILFLLVRYISNYEHKNTIKQLYKRLNLFDETLNPNDELIYTKLNVNIINDCNYNTIRNKIIEEIILSIFNDKELKLLKINEKINTYKCSILETYWCRTAINTFTTFLMAISLIIQLIIILYISCAYEQNFAPIFIISFDTISTAHSLRHMV